MSTRDRRNNNDKLGVAECGNGSCMDLLYKAVNVQNNAIGY